jgi:hypothetical protein
MRCRCLLLGLLLLLLRLLGLLRSLRLLLGVLLGLLWLRLLLRGLLGRVRKLVWGHGMRIVSVHEVAKGEEGLGDGLGRHKEKKKGGRRRDRCLGRITRG